MCNGFRMGDHLLSASAHPGHAAAVPLLSDGHMLWVGVLIGLGIGLIPVIPWLIKVALLVIAFLGAGVVHVTSGGHVSPSIAPWVLVAAVGVIAGLFFGRARGLTHLGQADFQTRMKAIRNVSRF